MDFPDLNHLLQLKKYLWEWRSSRAVLMVGAGLSLNSKPLPGVSTSFPTWRELARAMFDEIYPALPHESPERREERENRFNYSSPMRIASEYEAEFDRQRLNSFIQSRIPDSGHQPGDVHRLLLEIPWNDVYTTNYDTLLERTEVPGRAYQPVTTVAGLTTATPPRIIKLHGCFSSQTKYVITEEDYRTYPRDFAPFVNTVRQSLIENAFVLIGFSGDDPNFLEWTGWIRDELGVHHSPIYLVGPLSTPNAQRSLLARRGVTLIDISQVNSENAPKSKIHPTALTWFLRFLQTSKPLRPECWPRLYSEPLTSGDIEVPILSDPSGEPEDVGQYNSSKKLDELTAIKIIQRWRFERNQYPGWLVPTDEMRNSLWSTGTKGWIGPLTKFVNQWPAPDRLLLFRELNWRLETSMIPLFGDWIPSFESAINDLFDDLKNKTQVQPSVRITKNIDISDNEVAEAWLEVMFALLREARETFNSERWTKLKGEIAEIVDRYPEFTDRFHYEHALWLMWNIERSQVKSVLAEWSPSENSSLAMIWKAGLLAELDELSEARTLLRTALREIRRSLYKSKNRSIDLLSLEGWCTYLLFVVEQAMDFSKWSELRDEFSERWQELKTWDCDPWPLLKYFEKVLSGEPPVPVKQTQIIRGFDPWHSTTTLSLGGDSLGPLLPAFACVRLYEQVGLPMRLPNFKILGATLRNACRWISPFIGSWGPAILIRTGMVNELTSPGFMDRTQVATMSPVLAKNFNKWAMDALKREVSTLNDRIPLASAQASLIEILIEFSSRMTVKLESDDLQQAFNLALEIHRKPGVHSHVRLDRSCEPWFKRLFSAADDPQLLSWIPELIRFPLSRKREETDRPISNDRLDPMDYIPYQRLRVANKSSPDVISNISESTDWLLTRYGSVTETEQAAVLMRIISLYSAHLLTDDHATGLGILLWDRIDANGLPNLPNIEYCEYLHLPAPEKVDVAMAVKKHLLRLWQADLFSDESEEAGSSQGAETDTAILNWANSSKSIVEIPNEPKGLVEWTSNESRELCNRADKWWERNEHLFHIARQQPFIQTSRLSAILQSLEVFMSRAVLPHLECEQEWDRIHSFLMSVRKHEVYLDTALLYGLICRPTKKESVIQTILDDLSTGEERAVIAGARTVHHWVYLYDAGFIEISPIDAIEELIRRVIFRRTQGLQFCLDRLTLLLIEKPRVFNSKQVQLIVSSLAPWSQVTCIHHTQERDNEFSAGERPELRVLVGRLAAALSIWLKSNCPDQLEPTAISHLRESYKSDPLPEVRRSFDMRIP